MKKIIFTILLMLITINVFAKEESFYYNQEMVEDMWITRISPKTTKIAHPYLIKRKSDNSYVYCIEPFTLVENGTPYIQDDDYTKYGLTKEQMDRVNLITYYGFGYQNHTEKKWYGITQYLIWKTVDTKNTFYFTNPNDTSKKDLYKEELDEIEKLISEHDIEPDFLKEYTLSTDNILSIDSNINLNNYDISTELKYKIENNKLIFEDLKVGEYKVKLNTKTNRFKNNFALYYSNDSQNVILPGNSTTNYREYEFTIKVIEGQLSINKQNSISKEKLEGAIYGIYKDDILIDKVVTNNKGNGNIKLPFGEYTLKEIEAPAGYKLDSTIYTFKIDENNLNVSLDLLDDKIVVSVPDTGMYSYNLSYIFIFIGIIGLIYGKKEYNLH